MAWKTKWLLVFLCPLWALCGSARADEFSQVSRYSVRMFSYGLLTIETRMGDIHIEGWDEPRLEIEAEKVVRSKSEQAAKPLYERITVVLEDKTSAYCCAPFTRRAGCGGRFGASRISRSITASKCLLTPTSS